MTDYADVPDANRLHQEREIVTQAIALLDGGGSLANMLIAPGPPPPDQPPGSMMMAVNVTTPPPTPANVLTDVRAWLIERQALLDQQLADLGVTNPPARVA